MHNNSITSFLTLIINYIHKCKKVFINAKNFFFYINDYTEYIIDYTGCCTECSNAFNILLFVK